MMLLSASVSAALFITAIALVRALAMHRVPKRAFLALWCVAAARLLVPFSFTSRLSVLNLFAPRQTSYVIDDILSNGSANMYVMRTDSLISAAKTPMIGLLPLLWLAGALVCGLFFLLTHLRARRFFGMALPLCHEAVDGWLRAHPLRRRVAVRQSDRITTPLTYGIFRPVVLLPASMDLEDGVLLGYVLAHEYTHIRRFDVVRKMVLASAACVHWFNPLAWLMLFLANRDIELSCDERVLHENGLAARSSYALALIGMAERHIRLPLPAAAAFAKSATAARVKAIMKTKKRTPASALASLILVAGVTAVFGTTAAAAPQNAQAGTYTNAAQEINLPRFSVALILQEGETYISDAGMRLAFSTMEGETIVLGPYAFAGQLRIAFAQHLPAYYNNNTARVLTKADLLPDAAEMIHMYDYIQNSLFSFTAQGNALRMVSLYADGTFRPSVININNGFFEFNTHYLSAKSIP